MALRINTAIISMAVFASALGQTAEFDARAVAEQGPAVAYQSASTQMPRIAIEADSSAAQVGYGSWQSVDADATVRMVGTGRTALDLQAAYLRHAYRERPMMAGEKSRMLDRTADARVGFGQLIGSRGLLRARAGYETFYHTTLGDRNDGGVWQAALDYTHRCSEKTQWTLGADFNHFGVNGTYQNVGRFDWLLSRRVGRGFKFDWQFELGVVDNSRDMYLRDNGDWENSDFWLRFKPVWRKHTDKWSFVAGLDLTLSWFISSYLCPTVAWQWTPHRVFTFDLGLTGDFKPNTMLRMYGVCPWAGLEEAGFSSERSVQAKAGITLRPTEHFWLQGSASAYYADGALTDGYSVLTTSGGSILATYGYLCESQVNGYPITVAAGYDSRRLGLKVAYTKVIPADNAYERSMPNSPDRAGKLFEATVQYRPNAQWSLEANYRWRGDRRAQAMFLNYDTNSIDLYTDIGLRDFSDLGLQATYRPLPYLDVRLQGLNLLDRRQSLYGLRMAQGLHLTLGATLRF